MCTENTPYHHEGSKEYFYIQFVEQLSVILLYKKTMCLTYNFSLMYAKSAVHLLTASVKVLIFM